MTLETSIIMRSGRMLTRIGWKFLYLAVVSLVAAIANGLWFHQDQLGLAASGVCLACLGAACVCSLIEFLFGDMRDTNNEF